MNPNDLARDLDGITAALVDLEPPHRDAGRAVLAATRAPRVTGRLAASITVDATRAGVQVGSDLVYAGVIHNGWAARNIRPQPFLTDALAATERDVVDIFHDHITTLIRSA